MATLTEVNPESPTPDGVKTAVFLAVTAWCQIYKFYDDKGMSEADHNALYPMVLMMSRWDGRMGFVGGFMEPGDPVEKTLRKESDEEAGCYFGIPTHVVTHQTDKLRLGLYRYDMKVTPLANLQEVLRMASDAPHAVCEGCAVWVHLADYGRGKGFDNFRGTPFATAVKEELEAIRNLMYKDPPAGAYMGPAVKK